MHEVRGCMGSGSAWGGGCYEVHLVPELHGVKQQPISKDLSQVCDTDERCVIICHQSRMRWEGQYGVLFLLAQCVFERCTRNSPPKVTSHQRSDVDLSGRKLQVDANICCCEDQCVWSCVVV